MTKAPKLTREEVLKLSREFIDHFGSLDELFTIRHVIQDTNAELANLVDAIALLRDMLHERLSLLIGGAHR